MAKEATAESGERRVKRMVTIRRSPMELYDGWRDLSRLPTFMRNVTSVQENGKQSHWVVSAPGGTVEWDAEITDDIRGQIIAWCSLDGAEVPNRGEVTFQPALQGSGTEMRVTLTYEPPAGALGDAVARVAGDDPATQLDESVMRFKMLMETGHIPTTDGQSHGGEPR